MHLNSTFLRRTGRTQRMIEAATKAAIVRNGPDTPKDVMLIAAPRHYRNLFKELVSLICAKNISSSDFDVNYQSGIIKFKGRGRIQVMTSENAAIDKQRLTVYGFNGPVYFDHFAIECLYGHAIEKWLEFIKEDQQ